GDMGAGHNDALLKDPAIEEWVWLRQNTHKYFKINRRTAPTLIVLGLVVPACFFGLAVYTQSKQFRFGPKVKEEWANAYKKDK
ncbi:hypothetical protein GGI11_004737, partial [Coemansia sp. RSA 2049]